MKVINTTCTDSTKCSDKIKNHFGKDVSILHIPQNHIVTFKEDYDNKGTLKDNRINLLAWQLGGIKKSKNNINQSPPKLSKWYTIMELN